MRKPPKQVTWDPSYGRNIRLAIEKREAYPGLTKKQKTIADYLLKNPEDICYITLAQLSRNTDASEATLLRFCVRPRRGSFIIPWRCPPEGDFRHLMFGRCAIYLCLQDSLLTDTRRTAYLLKHLPNNPSVRPVFTDLPDDVCPMFFAFLVDDREN